MNSGVDSASDPQTQETSRTTRAWVRLVAAGIALVIVTSAVTLLLSRRMSQTDPPRPGLTPMLTDSLESASSTTGRGSNGNGSWTADTGSWGVDAGVAYLRGADDADNIATHDVEAQTQTFEARIGGFGQCGVVVRYQDPLNFVMLYRVNPFFVWNLVEVVDGNETLVTTVLDADQHDVDVSLTASDHVIAASVGFTTVTVVRDTAPHGTRVGLVSRRGERASECSWYDLRVEGSS